MGKNNLLYITAAVAVITVIGIFIYSSLNSNNTGFSSGPVISADKTSENIQEIINSRSIDIEGGMYYFKPNEIRVEVGEPVRITLNNAEGMHDFVIDELNVRTQIINTGESETVEFTPQSLGTYEFYCSVGNHKAMGMRGTLIVE